MRIGFDARLVYYQQAGIGQYILQLLQGLARLSSPHDLWVLRSRKATPLPLPKHVHQAKLGTPSHHRFESAALGAELIGRRLDLLHSPDFIPPFGGRFRSVITVHDLNFVYYPEFLTAESARYYGQIERAVLRADAILTDSHATRDDVIGLLEVPAERVTTVHLAAGAPYRLGREGCDEFHEPMAGRLYVGWGSRRPGPGSTGRADNAVQAYNFRLCLTKNRDNMVPIPKPDRYDRNEFVSLIDDVRHNRATGPHRREMAYDGIGRIVNMVALPQGKTDANNQHLAFISTDLPEENWPWPTSGWNWRDHYSQRLRNYTLGLIWFAQHHPDLPEEFRSRCLEWGLAKDEYIDNDHLPRQVYVREGRRIAGEYLFTAHDALPRNPGERPPIHQSSITSSHYSLDSHAVRKREPERVHLDRQIRGILQHKTYPSG